MGDSMLINDDDYYLCEVESKRIIKHYGSLICYPAPIGFIVLTGLQTKIRGYHA